MMKSEPARRAFVRVAAVSMLYSVSCAVGLLGGLAGGGGEALGSTRNRDAEQFVERNATTALEALGDRSTNKTHMRETFGSLMIEFADVPRISTFVLGAYALGIRRDPSLAREWGDAFRAYTVANYADRLQVYAGHAVRATGSIERVPDQDVVVRTEIPREASQPPRVVQWRMLRAGSGWKVADIAVVLDGNEIWLAQQQKSQFSSILDRNNGDVRALIASLRQTTATLEAHARATP